MLSVHCPISVGFAKLHPDAIIPTRGTAVAAGFDLYALEDTEIIGGCGNVLVPTGISVEIPADCYGRLAMRSGLAVKQHLAISAGVIDIDYTGGIGVVVFCTKTHTLEPIPVPLVIRAAECDEIVAEPNVMQVRYMLVNNPHCYVIRKGERFAQLVIEKISYAPGVEIDSVIAKYPRHIGYGSTGQ